MSDRPENAMLVYLRRIDTKMDALIADVIEVKERVGLLEATTASLSRRLDRVSGDVVLMVGTAWPGRGRFC